MNRVKSTTRRKKRDNILKEAKGYFGSKHKLKKTAKEQVMRSQKYSYVGRKQRKRVFKSIWINRINIACRNYPEKKLNYSKLMRLLRLSQIKINRKNISEMIVKDQNLFNKLIEKINDPWEEIKNK